MEKEVFMKYLKRKVILRLRNGWKHEGYLVCVTDNSVLIDDIYKGENWLDINGILSIRPVENGRDNN